MILGLNLVIFFSKKFNLSHVVFIKEWMKKFHHWDAQMIKPATVNVCIDSIAMLVLESTRKKIRFDLHYWDCSISSIWLNLSTAVQFYLINDLIKSRTRVRKLWESVDSWNKLVNPIEIFHPHLGFHWTEVKFGWIYFTQPLLLYCLFVHQSILNNNRRVPIITPHFIITNTFFITTIFLSEILYR